ncbi:hypothetical protein SLV14_000269 [Streptomyces sp. Je 1-4]|uniref:hypothetical protein n=1 Tax=unclassified Streptomyces TaxID=2593676 RepID=UPI0021DB1EAB|nr:MULTISPECIES: hypothetical protein [unclassified Streptomyces]UYB37961.1 hypothetical protein SLV14_000269 [Streptomyces sp. Je 1-4]UZQ33890.1 hypothetical protein SLV14N_000269 [Streptomyces sp. Je 1-4] [Streptomyces sp. Je 1-4 4N24]UZQ41308.1 hypothetical protein SLV14NA_000269 [Streptomyces sp. Je 1-4] [Streptomyces sp. Je 1-4 4N24_ara]
MTAEDDRAATPTITDIIHQTFLKVPLPPPLPGQRQSSPAETRDGAWVAELDGDAFKGHPREPG